MTNGLTRSFKTLAAVGCVLLAGCSDSTLAPSQLGAKPKISATIGSAIGGDIRSITVDPCWEPPPPPHMLRGQPAEALTAGLSARPRSMTCSGGEYRPKWAPLASGNGNGGCGTVWTAANPPLGSFIWRVDCTNTAPPPPPSDWTEHGFREPALLSSWEPIVRTGPNPVAGGAPATDDPELLALALEPLTPEEVEDCPDCVLDALALATDLIDIGCNGLTFGRGVAVVSDAIGLLIPGLPSGGGVKIARRVLLNRARTEGLRQHQAFKLANRAAGWIAQRGLPRKVLRDGGNPVQLFPDAIRVDPLTRRVQVRELKPRSQSGEAAGRQQAAEYMRVLRMVQSDDNGVLIMNDNDGNAVSYNILGYELDVQVVYYEPPSFICRLGPEE
jgi:hypothetical protein